jgi:hypothetical protein
MAQTFGSNGYLYEINPKGDGFEVSVWQPENPENKTSKTFSGSDLEKGQRYDNREQVEKLIAPLFEELDEKKAKYDQEKQNDELKERQEREAREREVTRETIAMYSDESEKPLKVEKDGTRVFNTENTQEAVTTDRKTENEKPDKKSK